ncbi:MAG: Gfo/Idh/MocA family oxidoreductase [Clostridia bacterium]|nr:Gfo/Idh/MocA family oxidoreductase [Clostridia bacterium]
MKKRIRFGIFGSARGGSLIGSIYASGAEVVAICDRRADAIASSKQCYPACRDAAEYNNFDEFIKHDMDAVLLGNYFCEHAEYAIKVMRAGKHVISETLSNVTMAEGVALVRAKEETGMTYALLENCPNFKECLEMERVYKDGSLGGVVYAEGEYAHPMSEQEQNILAPGEAHWRNWTPRTYYTTHALAPLMQMTDSMPTRVSAMASFHPEIAKGTALRTGDVAAIILCHTDTNAVFRITGWAYLLPHGCSYRLCGTKGSMTVDRSTGQMRLCYHEWTRPEGMECNNLYDIKWQDAELGKIAEDAGHGGGDFFVIYNFVKDLEAGREPYWNVYRATAAASVAILSWRSILNGGMTYDIPDFRLEEDRRKYELDNITPYPDDNLKVSIPCSSQPYAPSEEDLTNAKKRWKEAGFIS